jgi:hypothetical protein
LLVPLMVEAVALAVLVERAGGWLAQRAPRFSVAAPALVLLTLSLAGGAPDLDAWWTRRVAVRRAGRDRVFARGRGMRDPRRC